MKYLLSIFLIFCFSFSKKEANNFYGKYYSIAKGFERSSVMELKENGEFAYEYKLSGCQGIVEGTYSTSKNRIKFKNGFRYSKEYETFILDSLNNSSADTTSVDIGFPFIPDMSLTDWKISSNTITPIKKVDCGCFIEKSRHIKR
ncbi:hypothetical protein FNW25_14920 [Flavobacterium franklandianum]|uniref:hypothetical protein n=1 Tax=Flavobacterium franklandianum TaxID=2594430 RepID=UPI00117A450B|nr:hypothetical protein [Flavobacterium franklandianum]TRX22356.1 hypothetical protein FNW25_14920 [Flavobacterium franklandianum]